MILTTLAVLPFVLATAADGPAAKGSASGKFATSSDKTYAVAHAVAWVGRSYVSVVLSDKPFDVAAMGKDGVFDDSDLMAHAGVSLTLNLDPATRAYVGLRTRDQSGSGADFRCEDPSMLTLTKTDATHIAGKFKCEEHDVTFDAPIVKASSAR
jgi:hypothetical protein